MFLHEYYIELLLSISCSCFSIYLQYLYNLVHLDLSYNKLTVLEGVHTKLGNIKTLNLAGNQIETLSGLSKLYCLVNLDLSSNKLAQVLGSLLLTLFTWELYFAEKI